LMDTDGHCLSFSTKKKLGYSTSSVTLAYQVKELVEGLGGIASVVCTDRQDKENTEYSVAIRLPFNPFERKYKQDNFGDYTYKQQYNRQIVNIEYLGKHDGQCIAVESPQHLYLTDNYIVTHNTYMLNLLIQKILWETRGEDYCIAVTAPTHKALKVLREKCNIYSPNLRFLTVQSLLGLKEQKTLDGNIIFVPQKGREKIGEYDIVIVDEGSMVDSVLAGLLEQEITKRGLIHIIFSGDPNQLNPVNEPDSVVFTKGYETYTLTENMRQSADNPLMNLIENPTQYVLKAGEVSGVKGWESIGKLQMLEYASELFKSEHFSKNADFVRVLCWTNKAVDFINSYIRTQLFGENLPRYVVGEHLICKEPYIVNDEVLLFTNDEVEIIEIDLGTVEIFGETFSIYKLTLKYFDTRNNAQIITVDALHESSDAQYAVILQTIADEANSMPKGDYRRGDLWKAYYAIKESFANLKSLYALTVHNSQGSTFTNTIVTMADINKNFNIVEKKRLIYTALTRASHFTYVCR